MGGQERQRLDQDQVEQVRAEGTDVAPRRALVAGEGAAEFGFGGDARSEAAGEIDVEAQGLADEFVGRAGVFVGAHAVVEEFGVDDTQLVLQRGEHERVVIVRVPVTLKRMVAQVGGAGEEVARRAGEVRQPEPFGQVEGVLVVAHRPEAPRRREPPRRERVGRQRASGLVDEPQPGADEVEVRVVSEVVEALLDAARVVAVVRVQDRHEVAVVGQGDGAVDRSLRTGVLGLGQEVRAGLDRGLGAVRGGGDGHGLRVGDDGLHGAIRRAIVDDDDAVRRPGLDPQGFECRANELGVVIERDDDGDLQSAGGATTGRAWGIHPFSESWKTARAGKSFPRPAPCGWLHRVSGDRNHR